MVGLRAFETERDLPRMVELFNTTQPEPIPLGMMKEWEQQRPANEIRHRLVAEDESGFAVGMGDTGRQPWRKPGRYWIGVIVDPDLRHRGTGSLLYDALFAFAREQGATRLEAEVRDHIPDGLTFAEHRGFTLDRHIFESTLDLARFDETPFAGAPAAAEAQGVRFFTLADLGDTEEVRYRMYELNRDTYADVPGVDEPLQPWEQFRRNFDTSWYRPDGQIIAAVGDEWVGLGALGHFAENKTAYHMMTGVRAAYRGRGIAHALKLLTIRRGKEWGAVRMRTNNDSKNAPMLAVNRKFGFQPEPGFYKLIKELA